MITANGFVYGRNWGFSYNRFSAIELKEETLEKLKAEIKYWEKTLDHFDAGMGYETVLGVSYHDIIETIEDGEWTKTRQLPGIQLGRISGKVKE